MVTALVLLLIPGARAPAQNVGPGQANLPALVARLGGSSERSKKDGWRVSFFEKPLSDDDLQQLVGLKDVTELNLSRTRVSGRGLALLPAFAGLKRLDLEGLRLADMDLAPLTELRGLQELNLERNHLTDAAPVLLKDLPELRWLVLANNKITDQGLQTLRALPRLEYVNLWDNRLSEPAVRAFEKARPEVKVAFYFHGEKRREEAWKGLLVLGLFGGPLFALGSWLFRTSLTRPNASPELRGRAFFWGVGLMLLPVLFLVQTILVLLGFDARLLQLADFL